MRKVAKSFGHALEGLVHALATERNLPLFLCSYFFVLILGSFLHIHTTDWVLIVGAGGGFLAVELLNTAIERLADTVDDEQKKIMGSHYHPGLKTTKDVASAASLVYLLTAIAIILIVFLPHLPLR